jgi:hypothetical protein
MKHADFLRSHRCHDVPFLLKRWEAVAAAAQLEFKTACISGGFPVVFVHTPGTEGSRLYASAGVHGDEAAGPSGLLEWAEENIAFLRRVPVALFPIFNPAGLTLNTRTDHRHVDLNRRFHDASHPHIKAWWKCIGEMKFTVGACLHEDYDAQGLYCYELYRNPRLCIAETAMRACEVIIPRDPRPVIEGRPAKNAVIRRKKVPELPGLPEAIALFMHNTKSTLTFETPSEFSLADRVGAHKAFLQSITAEM